jgi:uroporphyrinogen decarboxylase
MMRQAGRFMPEYWEIKNKYSFLEMCKTPELAADVTMLPVDLLGIDALSCFRIYWLPAKLWAAI